MSIEEAVLNLLNGSSVLDEIDGLISERVVCRYQGSPKRRTSRGRIYYVRKRVCTGRPDPRRSQRTRMSLRGGGSRQRRRFAQRQRWRGQIKRDDEAVLPGQRKRRVRRVRRRTTRRRR